MERLMLKINVEQTLQPYKSFVMVFARRSRKNHAKPSLRSGADLKVKPMFDGRLWRPI